MEEYEDENILLDESTLEGEQGTSGNVMAVQVQNISLNLASYLRLNILNSFPFSNYYTLQILSLFCHFLFFPAMLDIWF